MLKEIKKYFTKKELYTITEIKSARPYYIGQFNNMDFNSCYFIEDNHYAELVDRKRKVALELKNHFNEKDFVVLYFSNTQIRIYNFNLSISIYLDKIQELKLVDKYALFKREMQNGCCGIIIIFRNQEDQLITEATNVFGICK